MKKLLFLLLSLSLFAVACEKDENPPKPIDKFIGSFDGNLKEYDCGDSPILLKTLEDTKAILTKDDDSNLTGLLKDSEGNKILSFSGKLNENEDIQITKFLYNLDTLFGGGKIVSGKLELQFATISCPAGNNSYKVTRIFKEK